MLNAQLNIERFCLARDLHPSTAEQAALNPELSSLSLKQVSAYLYKSQQQRKRGGQQQTQNGAPSKKPRGGGNAGRGGRGGGNQQNR